jgi:hypothetical protein
MIYPEYLAGDCDAPASERAREQSFFYENSQTGKYLREEDED